MPLPEVEAQDALAVAAFASAIAAKLRWTLRLSAQELAFHKVNSGPQNGSR
jgi:hypothetical protein